MLLAQHAASDPVAFGARGVRTAAAFLRDAAAVAEALPEPAPAALALLAIRSDRYAFAVALVGACARGYDVGLAPPQVTREDFLQLAQQPQVSAVLHDTLSAAPLRIDHVLASAKPDGSLSSQQLARDGVLRFVSWQCAQAGEPAQIRELERLTRAALCQQTLTLARRHRFPPQAAVIASVSPDTPYGLMFGCLWPLLTGGEFWRDDPRTLDWTAGLPQPSYAVERKVVVSVPAHVRMLLQSPAQPLHDASSLLCAGSPLPSETRAKLAQHARLSVCDLYAAEQLDERTTFGALGVGHGAAKVQSESASTRLELEETIAWLPGVSEAALFELPDGVLAGEQSATRAYQLAVVAPGLTEAAVRDLVAQRCPGLSLARVLVFDSHALLPHTADASFSGGRRGMVRGATGAHDRAGLLRLFGYGASGERLSFDVEIAPHEQAAGATKVLFAVHVPRNYGYFAGHFPGQPILPGAAQLSELVLPCVRRARPELGRLVRMVRLKFQERIMPDDRIDVALVFGVDPRQVDFALQRAGTVCAAGRLNFELPEPSDARDGSDPSSGGVSAP